MAGEENIKVAVRLRPFLQHIKEEADGKAKRIIRMDELSSSVSISHGLDYRTFTFDSILWSFDGYSEQADGYFIQDNKACDEMFCDQRQVYEEVGKEMVQNLWNGYNSTIFTFGESASGKSWTLFGLGANKGVVPLAISEIFKGIREKDKVSSQQVGSIEVRFSMAEIYNDRVRDLLPPPSPTNSTKFKGSVRIREHSKRGYYIEGLRSVLVVNHEDIQQRLEDGLINRAIFLTNISATTANSLTVVYLSLVQKMRNHRGDEVTRMATLEFIDLPSCEFATNNYDNDDEIIGTSNSSNPNLRNNGIDNLSRCVDRLLEVSIGKENEKNIPFYNHSVTKLLRNALLGNTKSYMIVTLSPSDACFRSSLFALKFAEKVRMLSIRPVVNEEVTSKLIREIKGENDKLRKLISLGEFESNDISKRLSQLILNSAERDAIKRKIADDMKSQIRENDKEIKSLQQTVEDRLKQFKNDKNDLGKRLESDRKTKCHLYSLNKDAQISGRIIHIIPLGTIDFGQLNHSKGKENNHSITFCGPGIREHHGVFTYNSKDGKISIKPAGPDCRIIVNETLIQFDYILSNNDRIVLGGSQVWIFQNPKETWLEKYAFSYKLHYEYVMEEMAAKSELYKMLQNDLMHKGLAILIPAVEEANSISEDLSQNFTFQPLLIPPVETLMRDTSGDGDTSKTSNSDTMDESTQSEVVVKLQNTVDGTFNYLSSDKFYRKLEMLKEAYMQFLEDGDMPLKELEAFKEKSEFEVPIGYSVICIKPLAYLINIENSTVPILDYVSFQVIGTVNVSLHIYDEIGEKINDAEVFIESPNELLDENLTVMLSIQSPEKIGLQFKDIYCKYKFLEEDDLVNAKLDSRSQNFIGLSHKHEKRFRIASVTENIINILLTQYLVLRFYGKQRAHKLLNLTMGNLPVQGPHGSSRYSNPVEMERTLAQLKVKEKAEERNDRKLNAFKRLVDQSENLGEESISVSMMKTLFDAKSQKHVDQSLDEHKELLTAVPEEPPQKQLPPELKALKRCSEICTIF